MNDASPRENVAVVIDDDPDARSLLTGILERAGCTVYSAGTDAEGIELVRLHSPSVTTLDIDIPDVDGFGVATRIRAFSDTYLLLFTTRASDCDVIRGYQSGADSYMAKPFRPLELRARVEAMLRRPRTT